MDNYCNNSNFKNITILIVLFLLNYNISYAQEKAIRELPNIVFQKNTATKDNFTDSMDITNLEREYKEVEKTNEEKGETAKTSAMPFYLKVEKIASYISNPVNTEHTLPIGTTGESKIFKNKYANQFTPLEIADIDIIAALNIVPTLAIKHGILNESNEAIGLAIIGAVAAYGYTYPIKLHIYYHDKGRIKNPFTGEIIRQINEDEVLVTNYNIRETNNPISREHGLKDPLEKNRKYCAFLSKYSAYMSYDKIYHPDFTQDKFICTSIYSDAVMKALEDVDADETRVRITLYAGLCSVIFLDKRYPIPYNSYLQIGSGSYSTHNAIACPTAWTAEEPTQNKRDEYGQDVINWIEDNGADDFSPPSVIGVYEKVPIPYTPYEEKERTKYYKEVKHEGVVIRTAAVRVKNKYFEIENTKALMWQVAMEIEGLTIGGANLRIRYIKDDLISSLSYQVDKIPENATVRNASNGYVVPTPTGTLEEQFYTEEGIITGSEGSGDGSEEETIEWECGIEGKPACSVTGEAIETGEELKQEEFDVSHLMTFDSFKEKEITPRHNSQCPIIKIDLRNTFQNGLLNGIYTIDVHCILIDKHAELIQIIMYIGWLITAFSIVLSA